MGRGKRGNSNASRRLIAVGVVALAAVTIMLVVISAQRTTNAEPGGADAAASSDAYAAPLRLTSIDGKPVSLSVAGLSAWWTLVSIDAQRSESRQGTMPARTPTRQPPEGCIFNRRAG